MSENPEERKSPEASPAAESEDERRRKAAEANRKATDDLWQRNKKEWLRRNFPEKLGEGGAA